MKIRSIIDSRLKIKIIAGNNFSHEFNFISFNTIIWEEVYGGEGIVRDG
jgi:hypothetical protein